MAQTPLLLVPLLGPGALGAHSAPDTREAAIVRATARPVLPIPVPAAVRRAGRRVVDEFKAGRSVLGRSGCLACHRLDGQGNAGPGPNLAHVGSRLSVRELERALLDPRAPMPSFRHPATAPAARRDQVPRAAALASANKRGRRVRGLETAARRADALEVPRRNRL
jgi:mono/diheme cytochrome c family protein